MTNATEESHHYDRDADGLIEITTLAQLDAVRHDLDGDGVPSEAGEAAYRAAFPDAYADEGAGVSCVPECIGYELLADIDFDTNGNGRSDAGDAYWNAGAGWKPIDSEPVPLVGAPFPFYWGIGFAADFQGNGHTVRHLFINRPGRDRVGLFGRLSRPRPRRADPTRGLRGVGVIQADVTGGSGVGALVGANDSTIAASYATGRVTGEENVGGLVGTSFVAGSRIEASYAAVRVTGGSSAGGLVGDNRGTLDGTYASGDVAGEGSVGGLVGYNPSHVRVVASYATGRVRGVENVGGLVGSGEGEVIAGYWDATVSGQATSVRGTARTTSELQAPTGYTGIYERWAEDGRGERSDRWDFGTTDQYPALRYSEGTASLGSWEELGHQLRSGPTLTATVAGGSVALRWTAVDTSAWSPAPEATYSVTRDDGTAVTVIAEGLSALTATDAAVPPHGGGHTYQVVAGVHGGQAVRSAPLTVIRSAGNTYQVIAGVHGGHALPSPPLTVNPWSVGNRRPEAVGTLPALTLAVTDGAATVEVSGAFSDADGDALTYGASSSSTSVATVSVSGSTVTVTPLSSGESTVTVTATDATGSNTSASRSFTVTVPATVVDYDADDDGFIEIATLSQLDAVRHDLDGDGVATVAGAAAYGAAFPDAATGMGCPGAGCTGYELAADLDFDTSGNGVADADDTWWRGGSGWVPIGTAEAPFTSTLAGNGRTISHLFISGGDRDYAGLFGMSRGVIVGVGLVGVDVTGRSYVGGLLGKNEGGTVRASHATGRVTGYSVVGGLVGMNDVEFRGDESGRVTLVSGTGAVTASYAAVSVSAGFRVGGLVGYNNARIAASYATGAVAAGITASPWLESSAGGLVGMGWFGEVEASYATGRVSGPGRNVGGLVGNAFRRHEVAASYWDTETSGVSVSGGGSGRRTSALQGPTGYSGPYAAWDVDVDGDGGLDAPWDFGTASEYPVLSVDADGDGAATWRELGLQGRTEGASAQAADAVVPAPGGSRRAFTDDPLVAGVTPVRAVHLLELRTRIDGLRGRFGLSAFGWTDARILAGVTPTRTVHLTELRAALSAAYGAAGREAPVYTDAVVTAGVTVLTAAHLQELRAAVARLEGAS